MYDGLSLADYFRDAMLQHGRRAVRQHLAENYAHIAAVLRRHGLAIRPPAGAVAVEHDTAANPGNTAAQPERTEAVDWPNRARAGHTGQPAHTQPRQPQPLEREPALPVAERKKWAWPK